jgi:phenylalanyl-tRNA synthetase beta chain
LAEEVARIIGYDNIKTNKLNIVNYQNNHHEIEKTAKIKSFLVDNGFYEVINFPFVQNGTKNNIFVDNPLDSSKKFLREELVKSLINNLAFNERRQKDSIKLFEISDVYRKSGSEIKKRKKLAVIASGRVGHNYRDFSKILSIKYIYSLFKDFFNIDMSEIKLIQRSEVDSKSLYPIVVFEIDMNLIPEKILEYQVKSKHSQSYAQFIPTSELPSSSRDLSFSVIEQRSIKLLEQLLLDYKNHYIKEIFIFDYYANKSKNETKVGYRFIFQSVDKTMTDDIVDQIMNDIIINTIKIDGVTIPGLNHEH